jgi:hypothetical protein
VKNMPDMSPKIYFDEVIAPTYREFQSDPTNVRRAMLACVVAYHIVDVIAVVHDELPSKWYNEFQSRCREFEVIKAIALVTKHIEPEQQGFQGLSPSNLSVGHGAAFSDGSYYSDGSSHSDATDVVVLSDGKSRMNDVAHSLAAVIAFTKSQFA